jgi:hypothetical protein
VLSVTTKAEQHIEKLLREVEPGSTRYTILHSARQFKSSWVELGELLSEVRTSRLYHEWGYADFAEYCAREIRIRRQTADKLTHAYNYLKEHTPDTLAAADKPVPLPDYRSLNLLEQINSEALMEPAELENLQNQVFSGTLGHPRLARTVRDLKREHAPRQRIEYMDIKNALSAAKRFHSCIESLPDELQRLGDLNAFIRAAEQALELLETHPESGQNKS